MVKEAMFKECLSIPVYKLIFSYHCFNAGIRAVVNGLSRLRRQRTLACSQGSSSETLR